MRDEDEQPIFIDVKAFRSHHVSPVAGAIAMDLLACVWWPTKAPFKFDSAALAQQLNKQFKRRQYTATILEEHKSEVLSFFVETPDGRWAPSPEFFSLTSGNPGQES